MATITRLIEDGNGNSNGNGDGDGNSRLFKVTIGTESFPTLVTACPSTVDAWISFNTGNREKLIVGLAVQWRPNVPHQRHNPVAILQLCAGRNCLLFQIIHATQVPCGLIALFANPEVTFVGIGIEKDAAKLLRDYQLTMAKHRDLREAAMQAFPDKGLEFENIGLAPLGFRLLKLNHVKPREITKSPWDNRILTEEQVKNVAIDAFLSAQIGSLLLK